MRASRAIRKYPAARMCSKDARYRSAKFTLAQLAPAVGAVSGHAPPVITLRRIADARHGLSGRSDLVRVFARAREQFPMPLMSFLAPPLNYGLRNLARRRMRLSVPSSSSSPRGISNKSREFPRVQVHYRSAPINRVAAIKTAGSCNNGAPRVVKFHFTGARRPVFPARSRARRLTVYRSRATPDDLCARTCRGRA